MEIQKGPEKINIKKKEEILDKYKFKHLRVKIFESEIGKPYLLNIQRNSKIRAPGSIKALEKVLIKFIFHHLDYDLDKELREWSKQELCKEEINKRIDNIFIYLKEQTKDYSLKDWKEITNKFIPILTKKHIYFLQHICNFICRPPVISKKDLIYFKDLIEEPIEYKVKKLKINYDVIPNDKLDLLFENGNMYVKIIIGLLMATGMRVGALCKIRRENINLNNASIKTIEKGNQEVKFKIPKRILYLLLNSDFLEYHWTSESVNSVLKRVAKKCNIDEKLIHPHAFRHTYAHLMIEQKIEDLSKVSQLLHHSSVETTRKYYVDLSHYALANTMDLPYDTNKINCEFIPKVWLWSDKQIFDINNLD